MLRVVTYIGRSGDTHIGSFSLLVGIAVERILIGAEKSYGEKAILSAVAIFAL